MEDREWSVAVVPAAANTNPQPAGSVVLDKTPGGRLMREYESIVVTSASSSFGDNDDDGMSIYDDFDWGDNFDGRGGGGSNEREYGGVTRAADMLLGTLANIVDRDDDDSNNNDDEDGESCDVDGNNGMMLSLSCLDDKL